MRKGVYHLCPRFSLIHRTAARIALSCSITSSSDGSAAKHHQRRQCDAAHSRGQPQPCVGQRADSPPSANLRHMRRLPCKVPPFPCSASEIPCSVCSGERFAHDRAHRHLWKARTARATAAVAFLRLPHSSIFGVDAGHCLSPKDTGPASLRHQASRRIDVHQTGADRRWHKEGCDEVRMGGRGELRSCVWRADSSPMEAQHEREKTGKNPMGYVSIRGSSHPVAD